MDKVLAFLNALKGWLSLTGRVGAVFDKSAWLLMVPALVTLYLTDPALTLTMLQWSSFALAIAGAAIIVSRVVFPQINLAELLKLVQQGQVAAAVTVASVVLFVGLLILGIVLWAKS